jgi:methionyl aminopeptidase
MRRAGLVVWQAHQAAARLVRPGTTTTEIDAAVAEVFARNAATPLFLNYPGPGGPFPAVTCISLNDEIVHGIPSDRRLRAGDIVSIDTGCSVAGWCGDAAITHGVGTIDSQRQTLLKVTREALNLAIESLAIEKTWRGVAEKIASLVRGHGFSVVESLVGHGIGRQLHEPPQVPNYFDPQKPLEDFELRPGLVLAIEPMVNAGKKSTRLLADRWTVATADGKPSAHFEHTVAISKDGVRRLTAEPGEDELAGVDPDFRDPQRWVRW